MFSLFPLSDLDRGVLSALFLLVIDSDLLELVEESPLSLDLDVDDSEAKLVLLMVTGGP